MMDTLKTAFLSGSSKHGNTRRASIACSCDADRNLPTDVVAAHVITRGVSRIHKGCSAPLPLPFTFPPLPSLHFQSPYSIPSSFSPPSTPFLFLPLRSRLPLIKPGDLGERAISSISGSGHSPAAKRCLVYFGLKSASGNINFKYIFTKIHQQICQVY